MTWRISRRLPLQEGSLQVSLFDPAMSRPIALPADRVVLSAGIEPNDHRDLAKIFDVELNSGWFFQGGQSQIGSPRFGGPWEILLRPLPFA